MKYEFVNIQEIAKHDAHFVLVGWWHHRFDAGNENVTIVIDELAHEFDEIRHRLVDHASEQTRVQILAGARQVDRKVGDPTKTVGQRRRAGV